MVDGMARWFSSNWSAERRLSAARRFLSCLFVMYATTSPAQTFCGDVQDRICSDHLVLSKDSMVFSREFILDECDDELEIISVKQGSFAIEARSVLTGTDIKELSELRSYNPCFLRKIGIRRIILTGGFNRGILPLHGLSNKSNGTIIIDTKYQKCMNVHHEIFHFVTHSKFIYGYKIDEDSAEQFAALMCNYESPSVRDALEKTRRMYDGR